MSYLGVWLPLLPAGAPLRPYAKDALEVGSGGGMGRPCICPPGEGGLGMCQLCAVLAEKSLQTSVLISL